MAKRNACHGFLPRARRGTTLGGIVIQPMTTRDAVRRVNPHFSPGISSYRATPASPGPLVRSRSGFQPRSAAGGRGRPDGPDSPMKSAPTEGQRESTTVGTASRRFVVRNAGKRVGGGWPEGDPPAMTQGAAWQGFLPRATRGTALGRMGVQPMTTTDAVRRFTASGSLPPGVPRVARGEKLSWTPDRVRIAAGATALNHRSRGTSRSAGSSGPSRYGPPASGPPRTPAASSRTVA